MTYLQAKVFNRLPDGTSFYPGHGDDYTLGAERSSSPEWLARRVVVGRAQRRQARRERFEREFGSDADVALDLIDVTGLAWHDCYGETTFSEEVLEDLLALADGNVHRLVSAARLAVTDWRDLRVTADDVRG